MRVGIVGAGIQGIGLALELVARGASVDLHEATHEVHARASLANEGKIHLGYIYANDPTLRTARQMVEGSWSFSAILRDWLEHDLDDATFSAEARYLIHRNSLLDVDTLAAAYQRIHALNREMAARPGAAYFGLDGARQPRRLPDAQLSAEFGSDVVAAYVMPEIALDTEAIGAALRARLAADPRITLRLGSCIERVEPAGSEIRLHTRRSGETESLSYDQVINATWADLLRIDGTAGVPAPKDASFRWRYVVRIRAPHGARGLPTCSIVLGPFGDLVEYGRGDLFLSWYPAGRQAMVASVSPPAHWSQGPLAADATGVAPRTFAALRSLVPALGAVTQEAVETAEVQAGIIYARGTSDIDDRGSGYHRRDRIGPHSYGRYHSVDTGKYTTAPLFARRLAQAIAGQC